ncbi:hypothetical protein M407DRAFT_5960 [Tulasnella calospora MUT 4182]|uniref:Uncharacterized protein n=1 Tax=Tulasnella calospora MUT 4182 TaxID=1051891 RepID=A0A0C3QQG3_9AGAM|nr:hypothetical protein M407DRAFT_5960 [Tulasnella calospora MUT 4182]
MKPFATEVRARFVRAGQSLRVWMLDALHGQWTFGNATRVEEWRTRMRAFGSLEGRTNVRQDGGRLHHSDSEEMIGRTNNPNQHQHSAIDGFNRVTTQVLQYFGVEILRPLQESADRLFKYSEGIPLTREAEKTSTLYVQALIRVFKVSEEPLALYHAATNLCSIDDPSTLLPFMRDEIVRARLWDLYLDSVGRMNLRGPLALSPPPGPTPFQKFIVYGAASYHAFFLVGSLDTFFSLTHIGKSLQGNRSLDLSQVGNEAIREGSIEVRDYLMQFLKVQRSTLGSHPTIMTSTSLAAYALHGLLELHSPYFSDYLGRRLRATVRVSACSWNSLALLAFLCNTTISVPTLRASRDDVAHLNMFEPTRELALAVDQALRRRRDHKTDFVLFKLSWMLFVGSPWEDSEFIRLAESALGKSATLLCSLEASIRQEAMAHNRREGKRALRLQDPPPWLQRKMALVLNVATEYINYLLSLNEPGHGENIKCRSLIDSINNSLPRQYEGKRILYQSDHTGYTQQKYFFRIAYAAFYTYLRGGGIDASVGELSQTQLYFLKS